MALVLADLVADNLITLSYEKQAPLTNLKLQKLLYYSQAWHLALNRKPLFHEDFEAWVHGPAIPRVFRRFKSYKSNPINNPNRTASEPIKAHLEDVWRVYGRFNAYQLERLTHSEQPWIEARGGIAPDMPSHNLISQESMRTYYSSRLNG